LNNETREKEGAWPSCGEKDRVSREPRSTRIWARMQTTGDIKSEAICSRARFAQITQESEKVGRSPGSACHSQVAHPKQKLCKIQDVESLVLGSRRRKSSRSVNQVAHKTTTCVAKSIRAERTVRQETEARRDEAGIQARTLRTYAAPETLTRRAAVSAKPIRHWTRKLSVGRLLNSNGTGSHLSEQLRGTKRLTASFRLEGQLAEAVMIDRKRS